MTPESASSVQGPAKEVARQEPILVSDDDFEQVILQSSQPCLVDFTATWCGPCQILAPLVEEIAAEYDGKALVAKLDIDDSPKTARTFKIDAIPALLVFKNGKVVGRTLGVVEKDEIAAALKKAF
ncbi:MAG: thioredoxin [Planctomycetes bacterium]|nr:thioredoxin [Planctomycetota bacterium]